MTANAVVRARIDEKTKTEADAILRAAGLTLSDAFRLMLHRIVADKALPFDPLVPNAETIEAMKEARVVKGKLFDSVEALLADIEAEGDDEDDRRQPAVPKGHSARDEGTSPEKSRPRAEGRGRSAARR